VIALLAAALFTPACRRVAERTGFLAFPSARGVHREPTPLLGGVAIFAAFTLALGVASLFAGMEALASTLGFLGGGLLIFVMGVIDDKYDLSWFSKLLGQIVAAVLLVASGNTGGLFFFTPLGLVLAVVWVVGLTNAMNFLDNMDGVCAGIAAVMSLTFVGLGLMAGDLSMVAIAAALCGASFGFLRFNFYPARIFLGDGGSLFLGYSLGALGLQSIGHSDLGPSALVAVVALAYPIFDITFVSVTRTARGQSLTQGGKDHTSHRLARIKGDPRLTAVAIYGICAGLGVVAMLLRSLAFGPATVFGFVAVAFGLFAFGLRLARLAPVPEPAPAARTAAG
jgi:UDP-GlcNAc:undecaprenyl-phosphate GlcNAc-1-phosphate transferase